jgi:hypothetical protein
MVKIKLDDNYVIFEIKYDSLNDLKRFYTIDYFEFIGLEPEIYINPKYSQTTESYNERIKKATSIIVREV